MVGEKALEPSLSAETINDKVDGQVQVPGPKVWLLLSDQVARSNVSTLVESCKQSNIVPIVIDYADQQLLEDGEIFPLEYLGKQSEDIAPSNMATSDTEISELECQFNYFDVNQWKTLWSKLESIPHRIVDLTSEVQQPEMIDANRCHLWLAIAQSLVNLPQSQWPSIDIVTSKAFPVLRKGKGIDLIAQQNDEIPQARALWGFVRVMMNEYPGVSQRLIDLEGSCPEAMMRELWQELISPTEETEVLLRDNVRYVCRWVEADESVSASDHEAKSERDSEKRIAQLIVEEPGQLGNIHWQAKEAFSAHNDEIIIDNHSAGLNFRDVMFAMGLLPEEALENGFAGASLGMEFAGIVQSVGSQVSEFKPGDKVFGFAPNCFSNQVITKANAVIKMPEDWNFTEAATIPTAFFTAYYALKKLGALEPGERVLIHGAAGAVGLAAIQIARHLGAEIYATAGTTQKRSYLSMLGVTAVFDSRSLDYAEQITEFTQGEGVDLVLNSLAGEAIEKNLQVLKPFGRFIELGKRDFYADSSMGLKPFRNNVSYFGVDADQLLRVKPDLVATLLDELMSLFTAGVLRPLPHREFDGSNVLDAFRYMQQSKQLGKIVVDSQAVPVQAFNGLAKTNEQQWLANPDATYLVTGGSKGLGWALVRWLIEVKGARDIAVVSRSGFSEEGSTQKLSDWIAQGITVRHYPIDLASANAKRELSAICADKPNIKGIFHAAALIEDALLVNTTSEHLDRVMRPKTRGGWALHQVSEDLDLDFFVLFSSATTALGAPGQLAYVAANSYLEGLADYRRRLGLPADCVSWGAVQDVGFVARNERAKDNLLDRFGADGLNFEDVIGEIERVISKSKDDGLVSNVGEALTEAHAYLHIDWRGVRKHLASAEQRKFRILNSAAGESSTATGMNLLTVIAGVSEEERHPLTVSLLAKEVERILCLPAGELNLQQSLFEQGMDSLMGVELASAIQDQFEVEISPMVLAEEPTLPRIADRILSALGLSSESDEPAATGDEELLRVETLVAKHVTGSDAAVQE